MMRVSEIRDFIKKTVKEMSMVSGGTATVTAGTGEQYFAPARVKKPKKAKTEVKDVEPKLAAGKVKNNYAVSHFGFTPAPSKPNRKSGMIDYKKIFEDGSLDPIQRAELITKLQPLKDLSLKYKVSDDDIRSLTFVATKAEIMKIWNELGKLGVQDYFDPPVDDSENSGRGTWAINAQEALDNGLILSGIKEEESLEEAYVPDNVKKFAQRKGVSSIVSKVARWAEKAGKRVMGGTAIGKNYSTLILDLTHNGSEVYINTDNDTIEVKGIEVSDYKSFVEALNSNPESDNELNESYAHFRSEAKTRTKPEQLHEAVKQIKKKLLEVDRLVEYTSRLRSEIAETSGEVKYKMHTERALEQIQEMIKHTYIKAKKLK